MERKRMDKDSRKPIMIKIINKSKDGITLLFGNKTNKSSWEEFNKNFIIDQNNKNFCYPNPELEAKNIKVDEILTKAVTSILFAGAPSSEIKLEGFYGLGSSVQELCEILECSAGEAIQLIRTAHQRFLNESLDMGIGFHGDQRKSFDNRQNHKNDRNIKKFEKSKSEPSESMESTDAPVSNGMSIGDMIKAKKESRS